MYGYNYGFNGGIPSHFAGNAQQFMPQMGPSIAGGLSMNRGPGPGPSFSPTGPVGPPTTSGGYQPHNNGALPTAGAPAGADRPVGGQPAFNPRALQPVDQGRDIWGRRVPDLPTADSPWQQNAGMGGQWGAQNPWMSQLGAGGAMSAMQNSPFTGYFNYLAGNTTPMPGPFSPQSFGSYGMYGGLANNIAYHQQQARKEASQQSGGGGGAAPDYDVGRGAVGAGIGAAGGAALGSALLPGPGTLVGAGIGALAGLF